MIFDTLANLETYAATVPQLRTVAQAMDHDNVYDAAPGHYTTPDPNLEYEVLVYKTQPGNGQFEFHKHHTYVEIVLEGNELMSTTWRELKDTAQVYSSSNDTGFFNSEPLSVLRASQGRFALFLPGEPFCTGIRTDESDAVKKVVFKINEK